MGLEGIEDLLRRVDEASARLDERVREAHAATKDLRDAIREGRGLLSTELDEKFGEKVGEFLEEMEPRVKAKMDESVEHVGQQFKILEAAFLGKPGSKGDLFRILAERMGKEQG